MSRSEYIETFADGPGGWYAWVSNLRGPKPLELGNSTVTAQSPWWIDYNHAPPGAGYLHMLACLNTTGPQPEAIREAGGPNSFIAHGHPTDFTGANISLRLKGELRKRGAEVVLLVQGTVGGICSGWMLTGQPIHVAEDWTDQTITLEPDTGRWTALGSRHDRTDMYGVKPLEQVLRNVSANVMLVLFPLSVVPMGPLDGAPHTLRAGLDYPVWRTELPEGYLVLDEVRIRFARP